MQINKIKKDMTEILSDVFDGATIMVGGFGEAGSPIELLHGLIDKGTKDLTIIANNSGNGRVCLLYTSPSPRDVEESRMPSSA